MNIMDKKQALMLIKKVSEAVKNEVRSVSDLDRVANGGDVFSIRYITKNSGKLREVNYTNGDVHIQIDCDYSKEITVKFITKSDGTYLRYETEHGHGPFAFFNKLYREFRSFAKIIEKFHKEGSKESKKQEERANSERFNNVYCQAFPEEINNILLDNDDDT